MIYAVLIIRNLNVHTMSSCSADYYILINACMLQSSTLQVEEKNNTWSWGILKMLKGKDEKKKSIREKPKVSESDSNEGSL
jgi:hypothetical protein